MEKFSLFDLLSILLPGIFIVFILNLIILCYQFIPSEFYYEPISQLSEFWIGMLFSVLSGGFVFYLSDKLKRTFLYKNIFGIYKHIGKIFYSLKSAEVSFFSSLNVKSKEWFGTEIFISNLDFLKLTATEKKEYLNLHNRFYSRAYYDLQYNDKIDYPKTYQSFYFFFRQIVTSAMILSLVLAILLFVKYELSILILLFFCVCILAVSSILARYFRSEMVKKLYIIYSIHLQNIKP